MALTAALALGAAGVPAHAFSGAGHLITGAVLGQALAGDDSAALAVGMASHGLMDALPHHEWSLPEQAVAFVAAAWWLQDAYRRTGDTRLLWGAAGAVLPDVETVLRRFGMLRIAVYPSHNGLTPHGRADRRTGLLVEGGVIGLVVVVSTYL